MIVRLVLLFAAVTMLCAPAMVCAQYSGTTGASGFPGVSSFFDNRVTLSGLSSPNQDGFYLTIGLRKYINSFTSYQFPDHYFPDQTYTGNDPISRLEWPWEQTFGVAKMGSNYRGLQVNFEYAATLFTYSGLLAQDSDWEIPHSNQKTTFSDASVTPRCYTVDASVGFGLPIVRTIQWLLGYRAQQFRFTDKDSLERYLSGKPPSFDPNENIEFCQYYYIYYAGGALASKFDLGTAIESLSGYNFLVRLQGDIGSANAKNIDYHVVRVPGPRYTYESTNGICRHLNLAVDCLMKQYLTLGLAGDFMRITTYGSHSWTEPGIARSWDGAKVWSEQKYLELTGTLIF